ADARNARTFARLRADDAHLRLLLLQEARDAGDRPRRSHRAHEVRDAAARIAPDLRARGLVVDARVVGVGELVEDPALAFLLHLLGEVARVLDAGRARRQDQLGAEGLHRLSPLDAQVLRHDEKHAVAADRRSHRQRDAGVARSRFDERIARLDRAAFLGAADHAQGRPILDRAGRVVALELAENDIAARLVLAPRQAYETDHRRVADRVFDGRV